MRTVNFHLTFTKSSPFFLRYDKLQIIEDRKIHMSLTEAKKKWGIGYDTLCCWLDLGYLPNVTIEDGIIDVGNIEPYIPNANANITAESVRKYILQACREFKFISYKILHISMEQFKAILLQLEDKKYIQRNLPDVQLTSNENFTITEDGEAFLNKGKFKLSGIEFHLGFKYGGAKVKIEK